MDLKFWVPLGITVLGVGFQAWQAWMMKQKIAEVPSSRSPRRIQVEKEFLRKMYRPVALMIILVLIGWLPYIIEAVKPAPLPAFLTAWGGALDGCSAVIDTSAFAKVADKYRLYTICHIFDPTLDPLEDSKIAISKPFQITGGPVSILIVYGPNDSIRSVAKPGTQTMVSVVLLPKDRDGSDIRRLADVQKEGGQFLIEGGNLKN